MKRVKRQEQEEQRVKQDPAFPEGGCEGQGGTALADKELSAHQDPKNSHPGSGSQGVGCFPSASTMTSAAGILLPWLPQAGWDFSMHLRISLNQQNPRTCSKGRDWEGLEH